MYYTYHRVLISQIILRLFCDCFWGGGCLDSFTLWMPLPISTINWRNDIQHNDTQHNSTHQNDTHHNDTQHNDTQNNDTQQNDIQQNDIQHNSK
jgi:hypothetical protein